MNNLELEKMANEIRKDIVTAVHSAKSGHPGGSLSSADIFTYLYFEEMNVDPANPKWEDRDRFVLSKGHVAPGLYSTLAEKGYFPKEDLKTLRHTGSYLQGHPDMKKTPGIDMNTGSLGQGISAAVGMALSGNLSNFAGGLIILIFKPFKVGDYIDGPGVSGTIKEIQIFHTILSTLDNRMIYVPNGSLSGNAVTNYSKQDKRRVEWVFGVEYGEDVKRVRAVLQRIINADSRILDTPAPLIVLGSLSASSVDITVRVWVKSADYWSVLYDINEIVYQTFNEEGIGFPFPQLTVHQSKE